MSQLLCLSVSLGVSLSKKQAFNFCEMSCLSRDQEVCVLGWGDEHETEVCMGALESNGALDDV